MPPVGAWKDAIGGAQYRREPQVNEIDAGDAERHVARHHHTCVQKAVQHVENCRLGPFEHLIGKRTCLSTRARAVSSSGSTGREASGHDEVNPARNCRAATDR